MFRVSAAVFALVTFLATAALAQAPGTKPTTAASSEKAQVVNLNTATAADLERLPGIGAKVAARIIEYRTQKGPFKKIEELMNVQGIGEKSFLKLRSQITVTPGSAASQQ